MVNHEPNLMVKVDVTNPGQFFACCGLLELSHRRWPGSEGWFREGQFAISVPSSQNGETLTNLINIVMQCEISGLTRAERDEFEKLEELKRNAKKKGEGITDEQEKQRGELGRQAREGDIHVGKPFNLLLDWWNRDDDSVPKTWAGRQEIHKVARAAQDAIFGISDLAGLMDYTCVLHKTKEYRNKSSDIGKVEPFYFDARRFAHRLDAGFSLDALNMESVSFPAVELLCLVGLQRFCPSPAPGQNRSFDYHTWREPLSAPVAAAVSQGVAYISGSCHYRFPLRFRDDQKRYKAFGKAIIIGGES